jgi:hypothetical protein
MTPPGTEPARSHLMDFIIAFLAPLLTAGSITDVHFARLAAREAIDAYKARGQNELVTIAQIVAFALAALDTLRLSMPAELSLAMKLKLRGNANALNRAARDNTQTLERTRRTSLPLQASLAEQAAIAGWEVDAAFGDTPEIQPEVTQAAPASAPIAATSAQHQNQLHWAGAMKAVAARLQASVAIVAPAQRKANALWIEALTGVASDLTMGKGPIATFGMSKAELLCSTLMSGGQGFPEYLSRGRPWSAKTP